MEAFYLFWDFVKTSYVEVFNDKKTYLSVFFAMVLLGNIDSLYLLVGIAEESNGFFVLSILTTVLTFIVLSRIVLIQKIKRGGVGELIYFVPTFLLYNLYYSFLFFAGLLLLVIPAFYVLFYFSMVPLIAVLDDTSEGSIFKRSKALVQKNLPLIIWVSLVNLLIDLSSLVTLTIQEPLTKTIAKFILSIPDAFLTIVMTIVTVKVFYYLQEDPGRDLGTATKNSHIGRS